MWNLVLIIFKSTFFFLFYPFFNLFFSDLSLIILVGWEFYILFFLFAFYVMIQPHDPYHKFRRLDRINIGHFNFFLISFIIIEFVRNWYSLFFYFFFIELFQYHASGHRFSRFTRFDSYLYFFHYFYIWIFNIRLVWELSFVIVFSLFSTELSQSND